MCGIIGFVRSSKATANDKKHNFIGQGLFVDSLRGVCGTGLAGIGHRGIEVHKRALQGPDFLNSLVFEKAKKNFFENHIMIGHNRAATIGDAKDENCHPFHFAGKEAEIVMVHNGTLNNYRHLVPGQFEHPVDSAWVAKALSERPTMDVLKTLTGAFVLVWYNKTLHTFNIARNSFREIYWGTDKEKTLYFASEFAMLDWLALRNGIEIQDRSAYKSPGDDEWWEFKLDKATFEFVGKPKVHKIEYTPVRGHGQGYTGWSAPLSEIETAKRSTRSSAIFLKELEDLGVDIDEDYYMDVTEWKSYNGSQGTSPYGFLVGTISVIGPDGKRVDTDAVVEGVTKHQYEELKDIAAWVPVAAVGTTSWKENKRIDPPLVRCMLDKEGVAEFLRFDFREQKKEKGGKRPAEGMAVLQLVHGAYGTLIPITEWRNKAQAGCGFCSDPISERDFKAIKWVETGEHGPRPLCHACSCDKGVERAIEAGLNSIEEASK